MIEFNLAMLLIFAEYALGLFFIGSSVNVSVSRDANKKLVPHVAIEWFPLLFGAALLVLGIMQKVL